MPNLDARLAEMLCTRLCHDLTGPIGALANGAEFLADDDFSMQGQAVELISQSAEQAVNRLQFYRTAYGRVNSGEAVLSDTKRLITDFFIGGKVSLDWPDSQTDALEISISRKMARLIQNMSIIAAGTLIRGGIVSIRIDKTGADKAVTVAASGLSIKWGDEHKKIFEGGVEIDDVNPSTVQSFYSYKLAEEMGAAITATATEDSFEMVCTKEDIYNGA